MKKRKKWTKEEEDILVQAIKANPHNLQQCFREVSQKVNHSEGSICKHWYAILANPEHKKYVGTAFLVIGRKTYNQVRKNVYTNIGYATTVKTTKKLSLWSKAKKLLGLKY